MGRPESARRIRLWSASTTYEALTRLPYKELLNTRIGLYEAGSILADILELKRVMVLTSAPYQNDKQTNSLVEEYKKALLPEAFTNDDASPTGAHIKGLMSELENTIVLIDKKSLKGV